jgi:HEAT repeat protein
VPGALTFEIFSAAMQDYCREVYDYVADDLALGKPTAIEIRWSDMAYWARAHNLYWEVEVDGRRHSHHEFLDGEEALDLPRFPYAALKRLRRAHQDLAPFFVGEAGEDFFDEANDFPAGEAGLWVQAIFDEAIAEATARLQKRKAFQNLSVRPHDTVEPSVLGDMPGGVVELRELLGYQVDRDFMRSFFGVFTSNARRLKRWTGIALGEAPQPKASQAKPGSRIEALRGELFSRGDDTDTGWTAVQLAELGEAGEAVLIEGLEHRDVSIRLDAVYGFKHLVIEEERAPSDAGREALLRRLSDDESDRVRARALQVLIAAQVAGLEPWLETALQSPAGPMRIHACMGLAVYRVGGALQLLRAALADEEGAVRQAAAQALGELGDTSGIDDLTGRLEDEKPWVREAAVESIGRIGDQLGVPILQRALGDQEEDVRRAAIKGLGDIGGEQACQVLLGCLEKPQTYSERHATIEALGAVGSDAAVRAILPALEGEDAWCAIEALELSRNRLAIEPLIEKLADGKHAAKVAKALQVITGTRAPGQSQDRWREWYASR